MNKKRGFVSLVVILVVVGLLMVLTYQSTNQALAESDMPEISAPRWEAIATFYADNDLLTRDNFDYEQAADNSAARWLAKARFFADNELLTREYFDYQQAADNSAARWQSMAKFYYQKELLEDLRALSDDSSAFRWVAAARFYEKNGMLTRQ
jgi:Tfp pilus assembly protein PilE